MPWATGVFSLKKPTPAVKVDYRKVRKFRQRPRIIRKAMRSKYNELGKSEKSSQRAFFSSLYKPYGDGWKKAPEAIQMLLNPEDEKKKARTTLG